MKNIDLTPLFQAIIALLAILITNRLIPYIKAHTTAKQQGILVTASKIAVDAAEQIFAYGDNQKKVEYAINYAKEYLFNNGYDVDIPTIKAAVEKAVYDMHPLISETFISENEIPPLEEWTLESIKRFCDLNDIPSEGAVTKDDYIAAIVKGKRS